MMHRESKRGYEPGSPDRKVRVVHHLIQKIIKKRKIKLLYDLVYFNQNG